jgi:hypothetical protein
MQPPVAVVDATDYLSFCPVRRVARPVRLELTEHSYPVELPVAGSWLELAFRAFSRLAARMSVRELLIVGTGNGLDALGALEIFDLRSLVATDLFEESLAVSRRNVLAHLDVADGIDLDFRAGDLLTCVPPERRFCLVYENLPNVRAAPAMDVRLGTVGGRFFDASGLSVPERFETYQLALHYECLQQARERVRDGGAVLTALGGRMPLDIAFDLHCSCGLAPELVVFDVKLQTEAELVVPGYARVEADAGVEFAYYAPDVVEVVRDARRSGLEGEALAVAVEGTLLARRMSASEALACCRRGEPVAHSVLMIAGEWRGAAPARRGGLRPDA